MSFSSGVKEELCRHISPSRHCQLAELAAILHFCGSIGSGKDGAFLQIHAENALVVRKSFTLLQKTFNISTETQVCQESRQAGYFCKVDDQELAKKILQGIKFLDVTGHVTDPEAVSDGLRGPVSRMLIRNACCQRAFLRGAFLAAGSMSDPVKGYHLEIVCGRQTLAEQVQEILRDFEVDARIVQRKKYFVVSVNAAARQLEDILLLQEKYGFEKLPVSLRQMAEVRLEHPEAPLKELGRYLDPPVGKSGVNHRLRKLCELADAMRS